MKVLMSRMLSYFPRPLPVGKTEHEAWASRIIAQCGGFADEDSLRWALANQLIHLGPQTAYKSDEYFIRSLRKAAANQVASQVFVEIKEKQQKKALEAQQEAAKTVEASNDAVKETHS